MPSAVKAVAWVGVGRLGVKVLSIVQLAIFGRLLGPNGYSEFALAILIITTIELLTEHGLGAALIQRKGDVERYLPTVYVANVIRGLLLGATVLVTAPWISSALGQPEAAWIVQIMAMVPVIRGFENLANITSARVLDFRRLVILECCASIIGILIGCLAWLMNAGEATPAIAILANAVTSLAGSYWILPRFYGLKFSLPDFRELHRFGVWVMVSRYAATGLTKGGGFAIAAILDPISLSFYLQADMLATGITMEIARLTNRVSLPLFSRANETADKLRQSFEQAFISVSFLSTAAATLIISSATPVVEVLLGVGWLPAAALMPWIAVWGVSRSLGACLSNFLIAVGRPRSASIFQIVMLVVFMAGVYPCGVHFGALGICSLLAITGLSVQMLRYPLVASILGISVGRVTWMAVAPILAAVPSCLFSHWVHDLVPANALFLRLLLTTGVTMVSFSLISLLLFRFGGLESILITRVKHTFQALVKSKSRVRQR